jgi:hypothetical protein
MLNKRPIFVNGFQRAGTNILVNLLASHPDICLLNGETHEVFYGTHQPFARRWLSRLVYLPILIAARQHIFWPYRFYERRQLPRPIMNYTDLIFYWNKMSPPEKSLNGGEINSPRQKSAQARIVCKNVNGVVLASSIFKEMYPDATFIGLVRNGLAVCEGFMRRGKWSPERFGKMYEQICQKMIEDASRLDNYFLVRFEDMVATPLAFMDRIYSYANLDIDPVNKVRLQAKASMDRQGVRQYTVNNASQDREVRWFSREELADYFRPDVNDNQIARLSEEDKEIFLHYAHNSMAHFGYV